MKKMIIITLLTVTFMGVLVAGITNYYNAPVASQGTYQEITGTSAGAGGDAFLSPALDIGFTFNYCGTAYTQLKMASDGYLALGTSQTSSSLSNNLSTTSVLPIIASLWDDLTSNTMSYTTIGTEPNRVFIAQWKNTKWNYNGTAGQNFQIRLYETSDKIELIYGSMITPNSPSASIGINCSPGGSGNFYSITPGNPITYSTTTSNNSISAITYLTSGTTYTFTKVDPNAPPLPAVIVSPTNGQSNVSNLPTLSWSSGGGIVTKYLVYFGTDGGGTSTPANILNGYDNLTSTSYTFANPLTYNTTYYWQIVPYNGVNPAANCPIWSFTTMADPTIYPPFTEGFENGNTHETAVLGWTQESVSGSNVWTANNSYTNYNRTPRSGNWNAFLQYSNTRWMFKPIQLEADINYRVIIYARQDATSGASIKISYGATATAAGMTNAIISNTNITNGEYQRLEGIFTPTASGLYYIGILGTLNYSPYYLSIDDITIELAPSVIEPSNLIVSSITGNSAVLGWTENNIPPATTWDIIYGAPGFNPNGKATQIQVTSNPYTLTGLQPSTTYEWYVRAVKDGNTSVWAGPSSFTTAQIPAELPLTENFEGDINWTIVNGTQTNKWFVGSVPAYSGNSAYISKDNGTTYEYNNGSSSVVHLYRDISFPAGALEYNLSFMFKCGGESTYDGLKVFLVDTATVPTAGSQLSTEQIGNTWYNLTTTWTEKTITINNAVAGTTKRLVFSWRNDSSGGTQPPAAIDNIELTYTMPNPSPEPPSNPVPSNVATNVPLNQILSWTNNGTVTKVDVYFGLTDNMVLVSENQTDPLNSYDPELEYSKTYQWKIVAKNDAGETAEGPIWTFSTMVDPTRSIPYLETFDASTSLPANWTTDYFSVGSSHGVSSNGLYKNLYDYSTSAYVTTPPVGPLTDNTTLQFDYRYVEYSGYPSTAHTLVAGDKLEIQISTDGTNFTTIHTIDSSNHITSTSFATCSVPITQAKVSQDDIIKIKFLATRGEGDYYLDIDNVYFRHISAEPIFSVTPESKAFGEFQINTVSSAQVFTIKNNGGGTLTINPAIELIGANVDQFQLTDTNSYPCELGRDESITVSVAFTPTSIGEKTANLKIVDNLSKTEHNIPLTGTGVDYTIYTIPYLQGFDAVIFPPAGWKNEKISGTGSGLWDRVTSGSSPSCATHSGAGMARFNAFSMSNGTHGILATPPVQLESGQYYIDFWMYRDSGYSTYQDEGIKVYINATPSLTGATEIAYIHRPINLEPVVASSGWYEYNYVLDNLAGTKYFIFEGISNYGNNIFLDDIRILKPDTQINQGTASGGYVSIIIPSVHTISPTIEIANLGQSDATVTVIAGYADVALPNAGLSLTLTGASFSGTTITINHNLGFSPSQIAYQILPNGWNILTPTNPSVDIWNNTTVGFTISAKSDGDVAIVFPQEAGQTLPVTLSNFTAVVTSENFVNIAWTAETETNHSGYNLYRNEAKDLDNAIKINAHLIDQGSEIGTQNNYFYTDFEVYTNIVYYYWLESVSLNGASDFYGPLTVTIGDPTQEPLPPVVPMVTKLYNAFPNPFNPNTNIRYSLKEAGKVNIEIYNMKGQRIKAYHQEHNAPGYYQVSWDGRDENGRVVSSGIYLYRLTTGKYTAAKKMILAK
ncbi:MAG: choice-of-anchor D domain-containing protein [Candidatus Cloacimonas sp.]|nr:choice-of-anchor D domain-containing protein [Candidatus Cloacimonas sp.]